MRKNILIAIFMLIAMVVMSMSGMAYEDKFHEISSTDRIKTTEYSPTGDYLAVAKYGGVAEVYDTTTWEKVWSHDHGKNAFALAWTNDESMLAVGLHNDGSRSMTNTFIYNTTDWSQITSFNGGDYGAIAMDFSHNDEYLVIGEHYYGHVRWFDTNSWSNTKTVDLNYNRCYGVNFDNIGNYLYINCHSNTNDRSRAQIYNQSDYSSPISTFSLSSGEYRRSGWDSTSDKFAVMEVISNKLVVMDPQNDFNVIEEYSPAQDTRDIAHFIEDNQILFAETYRPQVYNLDTSEIEHTYSNTTNVTMHYDSSDEQIVIAEEYKMHIYRKSGPVVVNITPDHDIRNNKENLTINYTFQSPDSTTANCSIVKGDVAIENHTNVSNGTVYSTNITFEPGFHRINVSCTDPFSSGVSKTIGYDYDNRTPYIQSANPSLFNTTKYSSSPIPLQGNVTDEALNLVNLTVFYPNGSIFWNDYQNLSENATEYSWSESLVVGNDTDGIWIFKAEAADDMQVTELPGLNPTSKTTEFEVDVCEENFQCVEYGPCTELNLKYCQEVNDTSGCDDNYTGNMQEFTEVCTYKDEDNETTGGGGGSGASWPSEDTSEDEEETTNISTNDTAFAVGDADAQKPGFLNQIPWYGYVGAAAVALGVYQFGFNSKPKKKKGGKKRK